MNTLDIELDMILAPPVVRTAVAKVGVAIALMHMTATAGRVPCDLCVADFTAQTIRELGGTREDITWMLSAGYATTLTLQVWDETETGAIHPAETKGTQ